MRKSLRQRTTALLIAGALVALASPALATAEEGPDQTPSLSFPQTLADVLIWAGQCFDGESLQRIAASGKSTIDPPEKPTAPRGPDSGDGGTVTEEGGHSIDPDG